MIKLTNPPRNVEIVANLLWQVGYPRVVPAEMINWTASALWDCYEHAVRQMLIDGYDCHLEEWPMPGPLKTMTHLRREGGAA